jgi:hypothetical protein
MNVTPITGTNFSRCRRNVTIAKLTGLTVTYTICESVDTAMAM